MKLEGSCHCKAVSFSLESAQPHPYQLCYCSICRKTGGGSGSMINLSGDAGTLTVSGREHTRIYRAMVERKGQTVQSKHERHFCGLCGSHLWAWNAGWPDLVHPVASAIDTALPTPPERVHMMVGSKAPWVEVHAEDKDDRFDDYPKESIADWHASRGLTS